MNKIQKFLINISLSLGLLFVVPTPALAQGFSQFAAATTCPPVSGLQIPKPCENYDCTGMSQDQCLKQNPITQWLIFFINLVAAIVGVGAIVMIIVAGLQYTASRDNPQQIQAAKQKMINVVIGLVGFIFLYGFLQWLIPGGVL